MPSNRWSGVAQAFAACLVASGLAFTSGCSGSGSSSTGHLSDEERQAIAQKEQAQAAARKPGAPLTVTKEAYMPVLQRAYQGSKWPAHYTQTPEQLWTLAIVPLATETEVTDVDARIAVNAGMMCGWALELQDLIRDGKDTSTAVAIIDEMGKKFDLFPPVIEAAKDAELGDGARASRIVEANNCRAAFGLSSQPGGSGSPTTTGTPG